MYYFLNFSFYQIFRTSPFISFTASHFGLPHLRATYPVPPQSAPFSTPLFGQEPEFPWNCQDVEVYFSLPAHDDDFFSPRLKIFSFSRRKMFACLSRCTSQITPQRCFRMFESLCRHFGKGGLGGGGPIYHSRPWCVSCTLTRHRIKLIIGANLARGRH